MLSRSRFTANDTGGEQTGVTPKGLSVDRTEKLQSESRDGIAGSPTLPEKEGGFGDSPPSPKREKAFGGGGNSR